MPQSSIACRAGAGTCVANAKEALWAWLKDATGMESSAAAKIARVPFGRAATRRDLCKSSGDREFLTLERSWLLTGYNIIMPGLTSIAAVGSDGLRKTGGRKGDFGTGDFPESRI